MEKGSKAFVTYLVLTYLFNIMAYKNISVYFTVNYIVMKH